MSSALGRMCFGKCVKALATQGKHHHERILCRKGRRARHWVYHLKKHCISASKRARAVPGTFLPQARLMLFFRDAYSISPLSLSRISISVPFTFLSTIRSSSCSMKPSFTSVIGFLSMA